MSTTTEPLTEDEVRADPNFEGQLESVVLHAMEHGWIEVRRTDKPDTFRYSVTDKFRTDQATVQEGGTI